MDRFSSFSIPQLLSPDGFDCACGRHHTASLLREVVIAPKAILKLPQMLKTFRISRPFLVMDRHTQQAAGNRACEILNDARIPYGKVVLKGAQIEPNEETVGAAAMAFAAEEQCDGVVAIGSGVINDVCKVLACASRLPQITIATAPSMDGYASTCAAMLISGLKTSIYLPSPLAVIADVDVLKNAPMRMIQAGLGDMIAKYVSLPEWKLAHLLHNEYWCEETSALARKSAELCFRAAPRLAQRDPEAVALLTEGLILSGICMCLVNVSGPASGGEHYVSHIWDMKNVENNRPLELHGIQTGVGTINMLKVYEHLRNYTPDREKAMRFAAGFDRAKWEKELRFLFGNGAEKAIGIEAVAGKHDAQKHKAQWERIVENWDEIQTLIRAMPDAKTVADLWGQTGAPLTHRDIGYTDEELTTAFEYSPEIRDRYVGSRLIWDLGLLDEAKRWITQEVF